MDKITPYAFVLIHHGNKDKYLKLEMYFMLNLIKYTSQNIIYLYSVSDTPPIYIEKLHKLFHTRIRYIPYNDEGITYNVSFTSTYTHFNILRTCNFIFAYKFAS